MIHKICSNCGKECEILEVSDVMVEETLTVSPADDEQPLTQDILDEEVIKELTYEKRQAEAEDRDRSFYNEEDLQ